MKLNSLIRHSAFVILALMYCPSPAAAQVIIAPAPPVYYQPVYAVPVQPVVYQPMWVPYQGLFGGWHWQLRYVAVPIQPQRQQQAPQQPPPPQQ